MKQDYNINQNPKMPSDKDINKHKDFEHLMGAYNAAAANTAPSPLLKNIYYLAAAAAAALIGVGLYFALSNEIKDDYQSQNLAHFAAQAYVNPPIAQSLEQFQNSFEDGDIEAETGGIYTHSSGTKLIIPANAFVHSDGRTVKGKVQIQYREFHDVADIFLSGIPMEYDSLGKKHNLESAGMMEVYAEQHGERLALAPGKGIDVEMTSRIKYPKSAAAPPRYNIYKLDEEKRNWVFEGIDDMELVGDPFQDMFPSNEDEIILELEQRFANIAEKEQQAIANIEKENPLPKTPLKPKVSVTDQYTFDLDIDDAEFPELKVFKKIMWQSVKKGDFTEATANTEWTDIKLDSKSKNEYELSLFNGDFKKTILVQPVLTGKEAKAAMENYEKHFADYQRIRTKVETNRKKSLAAIANSLKAEREAAEMSRNERLESYKKSGANALLAEEVIKQNVVNRFNITSLGIWNCDYPLPDFMYQVNATFLDEDGVPFEFNTVYQVDKSLNTLYRYLATKSTPIRFNKNSENVVWIITPEGKVAKCDPSEFTKISKTGQKHNFVLETIDRKIETQADVRAVLGIES